MSMFFIACGGTGGHLFPGLAVAEELTCRGHRVHLLISPKPIDREIVTHAPQYPVSVVPLSGWPGIGPGLLPFSIQFCRAYREAVALLRSEAPDAVLGMGGFTCAPVLLAARCRHIPAFIHESNTIPGKVTRLLGRHLTRVLLGFEECADRLPGSTTVCTGTPVRPVLAAARKEIVRWEGWDRETDKTTLLVLGGSQGARGLNRMVQQAVLDSQAIRDQFRVIHLSGEPDRDTLEAFYSNNGVESRVLTFCHQMEYVWPLVDLLISRSGASTLTEAAWFGIPSILIPYPHAAERHQWYNAQAFCRGGGGICLEEGEKSREAFREAFIRLISNRQERERMADQIFRERKADAISAVADQLTEVYHG